MLRLDSTSLAGMQKFIQENEYLTYKYVVLAMAKSIQLGNRSTKLFTAHNGLYTAIIHGKDYEHVFLRAIQSFIAQEDYEMCQFAQKWLTNWKIQEITKPE